MRRGVEDGRGGRGALAAARLRWRRGPRAFLIGLLLLAFFAPCVEGQDDAPRRLDTGRFTVVYYPIDDLLAHSVVRAAVANDTFPWLPRPRQRVLIAIAPDAARFRAWVGPSAPEWGAAIAFPESRRIVMQGRAGAQDAGDPIEVIRHELAHLALHERLGNKPPRWFDEGYAGVAAGEWRRDDVLAANVALALKGTPSLDELEDGFHGGSVAAQSAYALSFRAVTELASLDPQRGLSLFFDYWANGSTMDKAVRQAFNITLSGFEKEFQQRTSRRYGGLALFADLSLAMLALTVLLLPFLFARRARDRGRMRAMIAADEAADRAEQRSAIAALLSQITDGQSDSPTV